MDLQSPRERVHSHVAIIHVEGELFFGTADLVHDQVRQRVEAEDLKVVILRLKNARHLDATTVFALRGLPDYLRQTGRHPLVSGVHGEVLRVLKRSGLLKRIGLENVFSAEVNATLGTRRAPVRPSELLKGEKTAVRVYCDHDEPKRSASLAGV